jgi:hypothetical protein
LHILTFWEFYNMLVLNTNYVSIKI